MQHLSWLGYTFHATWPINCHKGEKLIVLVKIKNFRSFFSFAHKEKTSKIDIPRLYQWLCTNDILIQEINKQTKKQLQAFIDTLQFCIDHSALRMFLSTSSHKLHPEWSMAMDYGWFVTEYLDDYKPLIIRYQGCTAGGGDDAESLLYTSVNRCHEAEL